MREGFNPNKDKLLKPLDYNHQIIIPVYIPNFEGYFKDSFEILKLSLKSLFKTTHKKTYITIVNSGSHSDVRNYLDQLLEANYIHELMHTVNIGKLNAILKGLTGNRFSLVTITDADVLFLNNWQKATYQVFETFPKVGFVSPCPSSRMLKNHSYNLLIGKMFSSKLKFTDVKNREAMRKFAHSVGNDSLYNKYHLEKYLTLEKNYINAVVGGGHFVGTYLSNIFDDLPYLYSEYSLGGTSENLLLDEPIVKQGYWRVSTEDNYVYHLGNVFEGWMRNVEIKHQEETYLPEFIKRHDSKLFNLFTNLVFRFIISKKPFWQFFLRFKGLSKKASKKY